jgi:hypothetical protein
MEAPPFVQHRVNTIAQLRALDPALGAEIDLRDRAERLILAHDPFSDGEDFEPYLEEYCRTRGDGSHSGPLILNVKSERIEQRVLDLVHAWGLENFFFLDSSFPMIRLLSEKGLHKIAVRFSEYEPVEAALAVAGRIDWVWVDCFTRMPLDQKSYELLSRHFRLCIVSPELQGRSAEESIPLYAKELKSYSLDAICTKRPDLWRASLC